MVAVRAEPELRLDVRPAVARREDPFAMIMRAAAGLEWGQTLTVINDFQPRLLYKALLQRGFSYETQPYKGSGWLIIVRRMEHPTEVPT